MAKITFNKTLVRSIIGAVVIIALGIFVSKQFTGSRPAKDVKISFRNKVIPSENILLRDIPLTIRVSGRIKASNRMEIYPEVGGTLLNQSFKEGQRISSGQAIALIDRSEFQMQLKAQKSNLLALLAQALPDMALDYPEDYELWKTFAGAVQPEKSLPELPDMKNAQLRQFLSVRNILPTYYNILSQEERLSKYIIRAPYNGVITEALVDPGTMVRVGQKMGTFVSRGLYELEASLTMNDLKYLKEGSQVKLTDESGSRSYTGTVVRLNTVVDPLTQMVSAFLKVSGEGLREGMYLQAEIDGGMAEDAVQIKRQMLDGNQLFLIGEDSAFYRTEVEVLNYSGEYAVVKGLETGMLIPLRPVPGAFDGLKVIPDIQTEQSRPL